MIFNRLRKPKNQPAAGAATQEIPSGMNNGHGNPSTGAAPLPSQGRGRGLGPDTPAPITNASSTPASMAQSAVVHSIDVDIDPNDPLLTYLTSATGSVEIERINLDSPALQTLKNAGVKIILPLVSQGELIGLLSLGPRRSEQEYSSDDRRLLQTLATQAAPALRVAQLARQQQIEARQRERLEQELRIGRVVQQTLLPQTVPVLDGYHIAAHWQPARAVSGDFYDFIQFPDGRLGFVEADVTDKGVPAALVMASSRSILRTSAELLVTPGAVLERANNLLCPSMPPKMFVTCLYAVLEPATGHLVYANAGHNPPYQHSSDQVIELRARGMPLGLLPDMPYDEKETFLSPGDSIVIYSDGITEAHNPQGEMFGFPRLRSLMALPQCGEGLIRCMLDDLHTFTGPEWEQEDDVTFVTLVRQPLPEQSTSAQGTTAEPTDMPVEFPFSPAVKNTALLRIPAGKTLLAEFSVPSQPGQERQAMRLVEDAVQSLNLATDRLERLKTAVAEATMNAMEHGNHYQAEKPVLIRLLTDAQQLMVQIIDQGGERPIPVSSEPDIEAKLAGLQSPRGWGLFLIRNMVDEMNTRSDESHHVVELIVNLKES